MSGDETIEQATSDPAGPEPTPATTAAPPPAAEKPTTASAAIPVAASSAEPADASTLIEQHEHRKHKKRRWGEYLSFVVLAIILIGSIFVVAAVSPIIFDRIVPAVLGWETFPAAETAPEGAPDAPPAVVPETNGENEGGAPGAGGRPETETNADPNAAPVITATQTITPAVPGVITHTVNQGETLFQISRQYSVTVEAIVAANNIINPDLIAPGDVLTIPTE